MENNTFEEEEMGLAGLQQQQEPGLRRPSITVDGDARVVTVRVSEGRIADWKGGVRDWSVVTDQNSGLVNGVS